MRLSSPHDHGAPLKFLCDNCKAKYQIADEKVAGKTVRMKCRKCGHQIEVRAAVTETSVSTSLPGASADARPAPARSGLATSLSQQKPPQKPRVPTASGQTGQQHNQGGALAGAFQRHVSEPPHGQPLPSPGQGAVELSVTDEWYVAINGVPVGPVRISELRRKAAGGAVTEDSLCWQEGLEEWRPVRSIPELAALVREAAQGNRPSFVGTPPPPDARVSSPPARPAPARPQAPGAPRPGSTPGMNAVTGFGPAQPARSNVVPLRTAASGSAIDESPQHPGTQLPNAGGKSAAAALASAPLFTPAPVPTALVAPAPLASEPVADPFALPPAASPFAAPASDGSSAMTSTSLAGAGGAPSMMPMAPAQRRGVPLWFWPILLFTGAFGAAAAFFVFKQAPPPQTVIIQAPPVSTGSAATATVSNDVPLPSASAEPSTSASAAASASSAAKVASVAKTNGGSAAPAATPKQGLDLGGLVPSGGGPNVGGAGGGPSAGGGGLDSSSVQRVVASHQSGVKRTCWERGGDQKSSVNVTVSAQVGPAGNVVGTSSSGDDPVVAKCIENQVKTWMFSAPGSTTTVNIPFKFVRQ
ncbi:MAG: Signal recognition particle receptor protein FtsY [Labilithrix sp.]|nr:Signal recognition particle receptor protein FtsY [Labilithrix sp.]